MAIFGIIIHIWSSVLMCAMLPGSVYPTGRKFSTEFKFHCFTYDNFAKF